MSEGFGALRRRRLKTDTWARRTSARSISGAVSGPYVLPNRVTRKGQAQRTVLDYALLSRLFSPCRHVPGRAALLAAYTRANALVGQDSDKLLMNGHYPLLTA